jgi:signal transduction histidine kinase
LGSAALGLFPYASFPIALDPTMPAIGRLRQIAAMGDAIKGDTETLLFVSSGRPRRLKCKVTRPRAKGSKVLLLHIIDVETPSEARSSQSRASPSAPAAQANKSGMDMLREIAEQLREAGFLMQPKRDLSSAGARSPDAASPPAPTARAEAVPKSLSIVESDYLAKLAHELKTPLTAIAAAAEVMRDERLGEMKNERYLSYAADIHESATHALDVIASLLSDGAKTGVPVARLIALDLNAIVERTVSSVQALAQSCGLKLSFETDGSRPHVIANPTALRQILLNLLTNAIKFTPRGGDVRVSTGRIDEGRVVLVVRDTGCGMQDTKASSVETSHAAELHPMLARSNGIGLALVEKLVRDMGAEIEIDSAPQKGTAVMIVFGDFTRRSE